MNNSAFSNISFKVKVTLALLILLIPLYAAGYTLSGRITDENDTPLPGALFKITLSNSNPKAFTMLPDSSMWIMTITAL